MVMVNMDQAISEIEIINNDMMGEQFTVQNEEELWANDADRDGTIQQTLETESSMIVLTSTGKATETDTAVQTLMVMAGLT